MEMEFLRRIIKQIQTQLGNLTVSQNIAIVLLIVIMCGAIWMLTNYAAQREMVPLLDQPLEKAAQARILQKLETWDEKYELKGEIILVPKSRQRKIYSMLAYSGALPEDTSIGFMSLLDDTDIFTPETVRDDKRLVVKQVMLGQMIEMWPGVESAKVIINPAAQRRLNNIAPVASASVTVKMRSGDVSSKKLAMSVAEFVSGANARMRREDVKVIVDGKVMGIAPTGEDISSDYLDEKVKLEQYFRDKIVDVLPVQNALVQVDVQPRTTKSTVQTTKIALPDEGSLLYATEENTREQNSENREKTAEPGMMANVPETAQGSGGNSQTESMEDAVTKRTVIPGKTETLEKIGPGGVEAITATVSIPQSYFEDMAKNGSEEQPDQAVVKTFIEREIPEIKKMVMRGIGLSNVEDEDLVVVNTYWDGGYEGANGNGINGANVASAAEGEGGKSMAGIVGRYGKHIAISSLAMLSLFMVLMMVRKAGGPVEMTEEEAATMMMGPKPLDVLSVEESNIAEAGDGSGLLEGFELGDEEVRSQQVLEQIRQMVKTSPDMAAKLVNKWIKQSE
jgi:flagellar biosynthesis/type III secretory pathway M-ring protein FliF/YscJ